MAKKHHNVINDQSQRRIQKICDVIPKTKIQNHFYKLCIEDNTEILFGIGPAGTGKTFIATKSAIQMFLDKKYNKIIISRPTVEVGKSLGYLPGSLNEKCEPYLLPILDLLYETWTKQEVCRMMQEGFIEIAPLQYLRGRTFKNSIVLIDEAQNCSSDELKMILTRIGEKSKIIISGDIEQSDLKKIDALSDFIFRYTVSIPGIDMVRFTETDCQRHRLIPEILKIYK